MKIHHVDIMMMKFMIELLAISAVFLIGVLLILLVLDPC